VRKTVLSRVARFFSVKHTRKWKNTPKFHIRYQIAIKYSKWLGKCTYKNFPFQGPSKYAQIGIFGMKMFHLAILVLSARTSEVDKSGTFFSVQPKKGFGSLQDCGANFVHMNVERYHG
jgi:hypothetical protein